MKPLATLAFDNRFVRDLPGDPESANFRRQVPDACYSRVMPTPVTAATSSATGPVSWETAVPSTWER